MCLVSYKDGLLMGGSNGELVFLNLNYETIIRKKLHTDCLSSISECDNYIVTTGYDGFTYFLNKKTFEIEKTFEFETPIWKSLSY